MVAFSKNGAANVQLKHEFLAVQYYENFFMSTRLIRSQLPSSQHRTGKNIS